MSKQKSTRVSVRQPLPAARGTIRPRTILNISVALLAASTVLWAGVASVGVSTRTARLNPPNLTELMALLSQVGLDPKTLTAAGVSAEQAAGIAADAALHARTNIEVIRAAEATYNQDRAEVDQLQRVVQSGQARPEQLAAYDAALTRLAGSQAQRAARFESLRTAAVADLTEQKQAMIRTMVGNRDWDLPVEYLMLSRTEPQWVSLRSALSHERANTLLGEPVAASAQQVIQTWQAESDVTAAMGYLNNNLGAVTTAWTQGLAP